MTAESFGAFFLPFSHYPSLTSLVALKTNNPTSTLKASNAAGTGGARMALELPKSTIPKRIVAI